MFSNAKFIEHVAAATFPLGSHVVFTVDIDIAQRTIIEIRTV
jgi:hypothetical protein